MRENGFFMRGETLRNVGALPQVRETRIVAFGSLRFPISALLIPAQRAHGFNPLQET